jgi:glutamate-1-semialdehyde 2,1-aminomutase
MKATKPFNSDFKESDRLYELAEKYFPYGTQLFSRRPELGPFGQAPIYFSRAKHVHFWDVDGNEFVDTAMAVGPVSLGYCYDPVDNAVKAQIDNGILGSVNSPLEIELASMIVDLVPCAEMIKFCKTGGDPLKASALTTASSVSVKGPG